MKMKVRHKNLILFAIVLVMASIVFSLISFTRADDATGGGASASDVQASGSSRTNIDNIIDNSNGKLFEGKDKTYHILEIGSSSNTVSGTSNASSLERIVTDSKDAQGNINPGVFRNLVINGYRTIDSTLAEDTDGFKAIDFKRLSTVDNTDAEIVAAINQADLVYIYNDPDHMFSVDNDLDDLDPSNDPGNQFNVLETLKNYATADGYKKPLIIDSYKQTYLIHTNGNKTYVDLVNNVLTKSGYEHSAYAWNNTEDIDTFLGSSGIFLPVNGENQRNNVWTEIPNAVKQDGSSPYYVGKILTIKSGEGDTQLTSELTKGLVSDKNKVTAEKLSQTAVSFTLGVNFISSDNSVIPSDAGSEKFTALVTVKKKDGSVADDVTGTYGDVNFSKGKAIVTFSQSEPVEVRGIPDGYSYQIDGGGLSSAQLLAGYTMDFSGRGNTVDYRNDPPAQTLVVYYRKPEKVDNGFLLVNSITAGNGSYVSKEAAEYSVPVNIQILKSDNTPDTTVNAKYGDVTFTKGEGVAELSSNGIVRVSGLPRGDLYKVSVDTDRRDLPKGLVLDSKVYSGTVSDTSGDPENAIQFSLSYDNPYVDVSDSSSQTTVDEGNTDYSNMYFLNSDDADKDGKADCRLFDLGYARREIKPDIIQIDTLDLSDPSVIGLSDVKLDGYDFIVFEKGTKSSQISEEDTGRVSGAVNSNVHILFDSSLISSSSDTTIPENDAKDYAELLDLVSKNDKSLYDYVLISSKTLMDGYSNATVKTAVSDIANILIYGSFRGIAGKGSGSSSNVYTVLEIEPCYPIDKTLAAFFGKENIGGKTDSSDPSNRSFDSMSSRSQNDLTNNNTGEPGYYYLRSLSLAQTVASGNYKTADEISFDGGKTSLAQMEKNNNISYSSTGDIQDYYAWKLSRAKVAHATGLPYSDVNVVHMSSTEFNGSKKSLLDNYDAIFIGGDNSAYKSDNYWYNKDGNYYTVYFHNGDTYSGVSEGKSYSSNQNGVLLGNDITYDKFKELETYLKQNMPVIVTSDLSGYFDNGTSHKIDPESRMYKFLQEVEDKSKQKDNKTAIWDFDDTDTIQLVNNNGDYGSTFGGRVTVFCDSKDEGAPAIDVMHSNDRLSVLKTNQRPKLYLKSFPTNYQEAFSADDPNKLDTSTWITDHTLKFSYEAGGSSNNITAKLYIDDNSDSRFTDSSDGENEVRDQSASKNGELAVTLSDDYYGPVYWKVMIVDNDRGTSASQTGLCKIKRTTQDKMKVRLLQIMPELNASENNDSSLFLCTECQQTRAVLKGNHYASVGKYSHDAIQGLASGFKDYTQDTIGQRVSALDLNGNTDGANIIRNIKTYNDNHSKTTNEPTSDLNLGGVFGVHDHKFGIVKFMSYDYDDWDTNWFDILRDDYDVELTEMSTTEYDSWVNKLKTYYSDKTAADIDTIRSGYQNNANSFYSYYKSMKDVINGEYTEGDNAEFEAAVRNILGLGADASLKGSFDSFAKSSSDMDAILTDANAVALANDKFKIDSSFISHYGSNKADAAKQAFKAIRDTSKQANDRKYYDFYSLWSDLNNDINNMLVDYSDAYARWRNAKTIEMYFFQIYQYNSLMASVDDSGLPAFENTFSTIAVGAAEDFGKNSGINPDLTKDSCESLIRFANHDGNIMLFHDTLTYQTGSTSNMSTYLASLFGQNARHFVSGESNTLPVNHKFSVSVDGVSKTFSMTSTNSSLNVVAKQSGVSKKSSLNVRLVPYGNQNYQNGKNTWVESEALNYKVDLPDNTSGVSLDIHFVKPYTNTVITPTFTKGASENTKAINFKIEGYTSKNASNPSDIQRQLSNDLGYDKYEVYIDGADVGTLNDNNLYLKTSVSIVNSDVVFSSSFGEGALKENGEQVCTLKYVDKDNNPVLGSTLFIRDLNTDNSASVVSDANNGASVSLNVMNYKDVTPGSYFVPASGYSSNKYFMSEVGKTNINPIALTARAAFYHEGAEAGKLSTGDYLVYKYTKYQPNATEEDNQMMHGATNVHDEILKGKGGITNRATQTNEGIVTLYPMTIKHMLEIAPTTVQGYPLDMEDSKMTVYYALSGGENGSMSTVLSADPNNGTENYFLYQYNNVTYTGAGHSLVTGYGRENNDERRLFINVLVNTARKSTLNSGLNVYDHNEQKNSQVKLDATGQNDYVLSLNQDDVDNNSELQFSFVATTDVKSNVDVKNVKIYFDANHKNASDYVPAYDKGDTLLLDEDTNEADNIKSGAWKQIDNNQNLIQGKITQNSSTTSNLNLKQSYFDANNKAYVVIEVTDTTGAVVRKVIRLEIREKLYDLN